MAIVQVKDLIEAGVHFGHRASRWNPKMRPYIYGKRNLIHIIDLRETVRGILRAQALENVLLARAARGRDIGTGAPGGRASAAPAAAVVLADAPTDPATTQPTAAPIARKPRPSRPVGWNDPELFMPTLAELEAQVRRRSIGRTLVDICLDLAVVPSFCAGTFWNDVFDSIRLSGGSVDTLMQEKTHRHEAFCKEQDGKPGWNWNWVELPREALRRVLGFFIGEADVAFDPITQLYAPAAALAAGPS